MIDMFISTFEEKLRRLPNFCIAGSVEEEVRLAPFPAARAGFVACLLAQHVKGYQLPDFEYFLKSYAKMLVNYSKKSMEIHNLIYRADSNEYRDGFLRRASYWYEDGINHAFVYCCLVQAYEEIRRVGAVCSDPRMDWKLKIDILLLVCGKPIGIDLMHGNPSNRPSVVEERLARERETKRNNLDSSHLGNGQLNSLDIFQLARSSKDCNVVNGFMLNSDCSIEEMIRNIDAKIGLSDTPTMEQLRAMRPGRVSVSR